jgi:hypothetical protein
MNRGVLYAVLASAMLFLVSEARGQASEGGGPPMLPARQIPGITAEDVFPRGCVDCHINRPDIGRDVRLSTIMREWSKEVEPKFLEKAQAAAPEGIKLVGKHPAGAEKITDIPAGCLTCHGMPSQTAPSFSRMMHLYHLTGGDENPYLSVFQGECTNCHKLNKTTGVWTIPSAPEQ